MNKSLLKTTLCAAVICGLTSNTNAFADPTTTIAVSGTAVAVGVGVGAALLSTHANNNNDNIAAIKINSVTIGHDTSNNPAEVSTTIDLTNAGNNDIAQWQFGFCFMQIPYVKLAPATNPNLVMQICDDNHNCSTLNYEKASHVTDNDLSAAYTTILAPATNFPLVHGKKYTIQLLHSNQGAPNNYANVPQNFFLLTNNGQQVTHIDTEPSTYTLTDYNQGTVDQEVTQHNTDNWNNSFLPTSPTTNIVPAPVSYTAGSGHYTLANGVVIHNELSSDNTVADFFQTDLSNDLNITASVDNTHASTGIIIQQVAQSNPEGYKIQIQNNAIVIEATNDTGAFYALQTLRQLWNQSTQLAGATIVDYPRFKYRGLMLDTGRHFFSVNDIEKIIDLMAIHKLNTLHIHFSDDEGFRLDVAGTQPAGGTRGYGQLIGPMVFSQGNLDITNYLQKTYPYADDKYQHFYSASDLEQLITYANARKITIIPEIDIPGHARALIKALPSTMVDPQDQSQFVSIQGYTDDVLPVCTYNTNLSVGPQFTAAINNIVNQIAMIFNNQTTLYKQNEVSVGADEVNANAWSNDPNCQGAWSSLSALEKGQKFFNEMSTSTYFANHNPTLLFSGWQQLVQSDGTALGNSIVPANKAGHIWVWNTANNGVGQAQALAQNNYPTVLSFADQTYMDLTYSPDIREPGFTWATHFSDTHAALSSAASANAVLSGLSSGEQANIAGIEGALWSENLSTYEHMIYMALPKMAGLSEAAWSPASTTVSGNQVDWKNLAQRLGCGSNGFLSYLNKLSGVHYRGYPNGISLEVPAGTVC